MQTTYSEGGAGLKHGVIAIEKQPITLGALAYMPQLDQLKSRIVGYP